MSSAQFFLYDEEVFPVDGENTAENEHTSSDENMGHNNSTTADEELVHSEIETHHDNTLAE